MADEVSLQDAVGTPLVFTLSGTEYTFARIGVDIWCEFCQWINQQNGRRAGHNVDIEEMFSNAMSLPGMRWLIWRSLREHHKQITVKDVGGLCSLARMTELFKDIADLPEADEEAGPNPLDNGEA